MDRTRKQVSMVLTVGTIGLLLMLAPKIPMPWLWRKGKGNQLRLCVTKILVLAKYRFVTISFFCETSSIPNPSDTEPLIEDDVEERTPQKTHREKEGSGEYAPNSEPNDNVPLGHIPWLME